MGKNQSLVLVKESATKILANEVVERHSLFQLQCFVLAKEPTIQGKLQQCLREIKARNQSLEALDLEIEEQKDKLEIIDLDISEMSGRKEDSTRQEKLKEIKRQASVLALRFITDEYTMPLGVFVTREATRKAVHNKPIEFASKELMFKYARHFIRKKFNADVDHLLNHSVLLRNIKTQSKLSQFV